MILIFEDAGRLVATPNWTASASALEGPISITYRDMHIGAGRDCMVGLRFTFSDFHRRLNLANNQDSEVLDLR